MPKRITNNLRVRKAIEEKGLPNYEVARLMGYREECFSRLLRYELPDEVQDELVKAIEQIGGQNGGK